MVAHLDKRKEITISLKTKSKNEAIVRADIYNTHIESFWKALIDTGTEKDLNKKYLAAVSLAKAHGFAYKTTEQIAASSLNEIVARLQTDFKTKEHAEAILGAVDQPQITLSQSIDKYWECTTDRLRHKSDSQIRKWRNPRRLAMENFIAIIGDKDLKDVCREDVLKFRAWWLEEIYTKRVNGDTGNKKTRQIKDMLATVANQYNIEMDVNVLFANTRFEHTEQSRPPFEAQYVQNRILPAIKGMKEIYQFVIMAMADTGAREAEIFGLDSSDIFLHTPVPYIHIRPRDGYLLKTNTSERKIPLVGTALYAFEQNPEGFHEMGNPDTFSTSANKFFKENKLKPTPKHSIYSLRHSFKDRLRDVGAPEELIDGLMGHKKKGPQYGRGHKLDTAHEWLDKIKFKVPHSK